MEVGNSPVPKVYLAGKAVVTLKNGLEFIDDTKPKEKLYLKLYHIEKIAVDILTKSLLVIKIF